MNSVKRSLIAKSNSTIVVITSSACFVVIFSLVASFSLFSQFLYQNRVISAENSAVNGLKADVRASHSLSNSYNAFMAAPTNIIGGNPNGTGPQDGNNTKIVLDALPDIYDYPALINSLEAVLTAQGVQISNIQGTDDPSAQPPPSSTNPTPQAIPFEISVSGNYTQIQNVVSAFEHSIRPIQIQTMEVSGNQSQLSLVINAQTYWQPAQNLNISKKVIQ